MSKKSNPTHSNDQFHNLVKVWDDFKTLCVVFGDAGFKDSAVKINVGQIFKLLSPSTEVKSI